MGTQIAKIAKWHIDTTIQLQALTVCVHKSIIDATTQLTHLKRSKLSIPNIREKSVICFSCHQLGRYFCDRKIFAPLGFFAKVYDLVQSIIF